MERRELPVGVPLVGGVFVGGFCSPRIHQHLSEPLFLEMKYTITPLLNTPKFSLQTPSFQMLRTSLLRYPDTADETLLVFFQVAPKHGLTSQGPRLLSSLFL